MKNKFIILGFILLLFLSIVYLKQKNVLKAVATYWVQQESYYPYRYNRYNGYTYNPKRMYYSPYQYSKHNSSDIKRLQRMRNIMRLQRLRNNYLTWDNFQRFSPKNTVGNITGYSVPINQDVYKQMGITPYNPKNNQNYKSTAQAQELYSMPTGDEEIRNNGRRYRNLGGVSGKTGVSVIYD